MLQVPVDFHIELIEVKLIWGIIVVGFTNIVLLSIILGVVILDLEIRTCSRFFVVVLRLWVLDRWKHHLLPVIRVNVYHILVCVLNQILSVLRSQESCVIDDSSIPNLPHNIKHVQFVFEPLFPAFNKFLIPLIGISRLLLSLATAFRTTFEEPFETPAQEARDTKVSEVTAEETTGLVETYSHDFVTLDFVG